MQWITFNSTPIQNYVKSNLNKAASKGRVLLVTTHVKCEKATVNEKALLMISA